MTFKVTRNRRKGDPDRRGWGYGRIGKARIIFAGPFCAVIAL